MYSINGKKKKRKRKTGVWPLGEEAEMGTSKLIQKHLI